MIFHFKEPSKYSYIYLTTLKSVTRSACEIRFTSVAYFVIFQRPVVLPYLLEMTSSTTLFPLLVTLACLARSSSAWRVWLYRDDNHRGGHMELSGDGCENLPGDFNDRTTSINTHGGCVRLYEHGGCTGRMLEVFPGSGAHNNLGFNDFNDVTTSVGNCPRRRRNAEAFNSFKNQNW